jgi:hypothetical protein
MSSQVPPLLQPQRADAHAEAPDVLDLIPEAREYHRAWADAQRAVIREMGAEQSERWEADRKAAVKWGSYLLASAATPTSLPERCGQLFVELCAPADAVAVFFCNPRGHELPLEGLDKWKRAMHTAIRGAYGALNRAPAEAQRTHQGVQAILDAVAPFAAKLLWVVKILRLGDAATATHADLVTAARAELANCRPDVVPLIRQLARAVVFDQALLAAEQVGAGEAAADTPPADAPAAAPDALPEQTSPAARAIALVLEAQRAGRPIPRVKDLATMVGCDRSTLFRDPQFKSVHKAARNQPLALRRGRRTDSGDLEAEAD